MRAARAEPSRLLAAAVLAAALAPLARADESPEISVHAGKMLFNPGNASEPGNRETSLGIAYGAMILRAVGPFAAVGLDVDFLKPGDKTSDTLIANAHTAMSVDSASVLGVARLGPTEGDLRPHLLLGLGVHYSSIRLEAQPKPGYAWVDTSTDEKRTLIDSGAFGPAFKVQAGADYALSDNFLAGAYLAFNVLGHANYEATSQSKSMGLDSVSGSMSAISGGISLTGRF